MADLVIQAELIKLGRALGTAPERVEFLAGLPPDDLRRLRERVSASLFDRHRAGFQRMAAASRLLPIGVLAKIAEGTMPPMLAARIAAEMAPERAAELATRLGTPYLADVCVELDPRAAGPIIANLPTKVVVVVAAELVRRGEYVTIGRLVEAASDSVIGAVMEIVTGDEPLLRIAIYVESPEQLDRVVDVLPAPRVRRLVHAAVSGQRELRAEVLSLIGRMTEPGQRRLAAVVGDAGPAAVAAVIGAAEELDVDGDLPFVDGLRSLRTA